MDPNVENIDPNLIALEDKGGGLKRKRADENGPANPSLMKPTAASQAKVGPAAKVTTAKTTGVTRAGSGTVKPATSTLAKTLSKPTLQPPPAKRPKVAAAAPAPRRTTTAAPVDPSKLPAWDIKGRLQMMESVTKQLQSQINSLGGQLTQREGELKTVSVAKETLQVDLSKYNREAEELSSRCQDLLKVIDSNDQRHQLEAETLQSKIKLLQTRLDSTEVQLKTTKSELDRSLFNAEQQATEIEELKRELKKTKDALKSSNQLSEEQATKIRGMEQQLDEQKENIAYLETKARDDEEIRRKLHNTILELKGNIRVFCRVRPSLKHDDADPSVSYVFPKADDTQLEIVSTQARDVTGCKTAPEKKFNFKFDKVFPSNTSQGNVFEEISQLVQSALDGYNTCIFAYGQTGSGKTFTMEGPEPQYASPENAGMISRAVEQIFNTSYKLREKGWEYEMHASFLEIYNETLRDLLEKKPSKASIDKDDDKKYEIKHDPITGKTSVTNLTLVPVRSPEQVNELLKMANKNRAVGTTNMNHRSSRSHSVFQLRLVGKNKFTDQTSEGLLNLIDLAGSERLAQSGATGDRLKETQNINKSLSCLGDVIAALANKAQHVPYRNSKLTYLLSGSLGGNSKTLMFVNVSPSSSSLNESLNSLRFAQKVNACEIGTARSNTKVDFGN